MVKESFRIATGRIRGRNAYEAAVCKYADLFGNHRSVNLYPGQAGKNKIKGAYKCEDERSLELNISLSGKRN